MKCLVIAPAQKQVGLYQIFKTVIDNILMTFTWRSDGFFQMSFSNFWQIMSPIELCQISANLISINQKQKLGLKTYLDAGQVPQKKCGHSCESVLFNTSWVIMRECHILSSH